MKRVIFFGFIFLLQMSNILEGTSKNDELFLVDIEEENGKKIETLINQKNDVCIHTDEQSNELMYWNVALHMIHEWAVDHAFSPAPIRYDNPCDKCKFDCFLLANNSLYAPKNINLKHFLCQLIQFFNYYVLGCSSTLTLNSTATATTYFFSHLNIKNDLHLLLQRRIKQIIHILMFRALLIANDYGIEGQAQRTHLLECAKYDLVVRFFNKGKNFFENEQEYALLMGKAELFFQAYSKQRYLNNFYHILTNYEKTIIDFLNSKDEYYYSIADELLYKDEDLKVQMGQKHPILLDTDPKENVLNFVKHIVINRIVQINKFKYTF